MKQAVNFRLTNHAINTLLLLETKLHLSKTAIIEKALQSYAKKEVSAQDLILGYAGILSEEEASSMLTAIKSSKHNKDIKVKL